MMRRRMAQMNARMNPGMSAGGGAVSHDGKGGGGGGGAPAPSYNSANMQGKPGAGPNQNVLDAVKKVMSSLVNFSIY